MSVVSTSDVIDDSKAEGLPLLVRAPTCSGKSFSSSDIYFINLYKSLESSVHLRLNLDN